MWNIVLFNLLYVIIIKKELQLTLLHTQFLFIKFINQFENPFNRTLDALQFWK